MAILSIDVDTAGQIGVNPRRVKIISTDNLSTVTTAGYLNNKSLLGNTLLQTDFVDMTYSFNPATGTGTNQTFTVSISSAGIVTLALWVPGGSVLLPVVDGDFANFNGTSGQVEDAGYSPSDATKTKVVMAGSAVVVGAIAKFSDTAGTIDDAAGTATNPGSIQAGASGTAGTLISYPSTASKGSLIVAAVANTGNTNTTISNVAMGQASVISIPDPSTATANFAIAPSALVNNNLVKASGTTGLIVDAGARIIANTTATYAGGGTSNAFTATGLTASCVGSAVIRTSTNAVAIAKAVPSTNTLTVTFTADPGAGTTVDYVYLTATQA